MTPEQFGRILIIHGSIMVALSITGFVYILYTWKKQLHTDEYIEIKTIYTDRVIEANRKNK